MVRPDPRAYGLPAGHDWKANKGRIESRETAVGCVAGLIGWGGGCALAVLIINVLHSLIGNWALWTLPVLFIGGIAGTGLLVTKVLTPRFVDTDAEQAKAYGAALEAYEYHQLETGIGFWKVLRGVPFEHAIARLFNTRGCKAKMTTTTGDCGIDIILTIGGRTLWCQCKGHAAPISVAPIREIAGVCSKGECHPVVFAVNGYTKAARETAQKLGVRLVDASDRRACSDGTDHELMTREKCGVIRRRRGDSHNDYGLSRARRAPAIQGISPVYAVEQAGQLRARQGHHAILRRGQEPIPSYRTEFRSCSLSRRWTSRSRTSRMKAALRCRPTNLSIRSPSPSGNRILVDFTLSGGLPILAW